MSEARKTARIDTKIEIAAKPADVYKTYTSPAEIRFWYGAVAQLALRRQGHFTIADDSGDVYESGEYLEVLPGERLEYKMEHHGFCRGSHVTVRFESISERCQLTVEHVNLSEVDAQHMRATWNWALSNLKSWIEDGRVQRFERWFETNKAHYQLP